MCVSVTIFPAAITKRKQSKQYAKRNYPGKRLSKYSVRVEAPPLPAQVCTDPDDDMFIACALASGAKLICSGDKALLATTGFRGIQVITARDFVENYL